MAESVCTVYGAASIATAMRPEVLHRPRRVDDEDEEMQLVRVRLSARDSLWSTHIIKLVQGARGHRAALRQPLAGAEGAVVM